MSPATKTFVRGSQIRKSNRKNDEWVALADVLERKSVPDTQDLLGRYRVKLSGTGELVEYEQEVRMKNEKKKKVE